MIMVSAFLKPHSNSLYFFPSLQSGHERVLTICPRLPLTSQPKTCSGSGGVPRTSRASEESGRGQQTTLPAIEHMGICSHWFCLVLPRAALAFCPSLIIENANIRVPGKLCVSALCLIPCSGYTGWFGVPSPS